MSGRVTIACAWSCGIPATVANRWSGGDENEDNEVFVCIKHESVEHRRDSRDLLYSVYARLYNPSLCTDSDIANVRAFVEVVSRICRALWCDDAESREDWAVMRLCAEEVRFTVYERCPLSLVDRGTIHGVTDVKCPACHGAGLVLRDDARLDDERRAG